MFEKRETYKTGFRTCYNCHKHGNCKLLKMAGVTEADMFNKCPDLNMIKQPPKKR